MPELLWGVSRGKPPTTRHPHPLLLSRCDGSGGGEMPDFEAYNRPIWRSISAWYS